MAYVVRIGKTAYAVSLNELFTATRWCEMTDDRPTGKSPETIANKPGAAVRQDKLAAALRDNLLKRKQQSRARATVSDPQDTQKMNE